MKSNAAPGDLFRPAELWMPCKTQKKYSHLHPIWGDAEMLCGKFDATATTAAAAAAAAAEGADSSCAHYTQLVFASVR